MEINHQTKAHTHPPKSDLDELSIILSPYLKKLIKTAIILARVPVQDEGSSVYNKMSLWMDDISRFIYLTSTFSNVHLVETSHQSLKTNIKTTNLSVIDAMEEVGKLLNDSNDLTLVTEHIEKQMLPLLTHWKTRLIEPVKKTIHELS